MDRRSLLDDDMTPTREREDVFGDEFEAEEDFDMVADGFRPSDNDREVTTRREGAEEEAGEADQEEQPVRSVAAYYSSHPVSSVTPTAPVRNSISKPRQPENPFASHEDDAAASASLSFEPDRIRRAVSSASSHQFAGTSSPRFGAGPSHPYGMYPQGTMARSPSVATSSTARQHRGHSSVLAGAPQHPYTLYPQGVSDDLDDEDDVVQENPVPIGFPGLGRSYQRRLGPDGEEQDIIGADGHTEQLPPYTRYPEDAPEKMPLLEVPTAPRALHSRAPVAGTDPTMELMHNSIRPQTPSAPQSMSDSATLLARQNTRSTMRSVRSVRSVSDTDSDLDTAHTKKSWSEKSWKEKRKTKFCGIPFWWILLSVCVVTFIAAVLGGVIGGFVEKVQQHRPPRPRPTSLYDASTIATPLSIAPPTGTFALSFSTPQETQAACLTETDQQAAWSCDLAGDQSAPAISVELVAGQNASGAYIYYNSNDQHIMYGTQLSWMQSSFAQFIAVQDNNDPTCGPAYYFQNFYDKLVVVPEAALSNASSSSKTKRQVQLDQSWLQQKQIAQPGDKPWFCVFNNTFLEGFIYINEPVSPSYSQISNSSTISTASSSSSTDAPSSTSASSTPPPMTAMHPTTAPTSATFANPTTAASGSYRPPEAQSSASAVHNKRQYDPLSIYPYVIKIEERRLSGNSVQPYCQQYQILDDGQYNWVADSDGSPIIIYLDEDDPSYSAYQSAGIAGSSRSKEKRLVPGGCHCQWMSGQSGT